MLFLSLFIKLAHFVVRCAITPQTDKLHLPHRRSKLTEHLLPRNSVSLLVPLGRMEVETAMHAPLSYTGSFPSVHKQGPVFIALDIS